MKARFFDLAKKMSYKSTHPEHRIGGVIVKKSRVISLGFNKPKTHTKSNHLYKNIHCELDCILSAEKGDLQGSTLYLYRENKQGVPSLSRPCKWCQVLIREVGIKAVCYTDHNSFKKEML